MSPCLLFEDDHLLVANKPAGLNTHAPEPYAGEGLYDWLRHGEPRWASLAIIHRLDKETSGVIVFAKTPVANRSLTEQFTRRTVRKRYLLLTDHQVPGRDITVRSTLVRAGDKYVSRGAAAGGQLAETQFKPLTSDVRSAANLSQPPQPPHVGCYNMLSAVPLTGRTHQIRVHAAEQGFPILGDTLYGGTPAPRVFLHAAELTLKHPDTGKEVTFRAAPDFGSDPRLALRAALIEPALTNACRLVHGASDGAPGFYVERLGDYLLSQGEAPLSEAQRSKLATLQEALNARGVYHKRLTRRVRHTSPAAVSPMIELGKPARGPFVARENGLEFELSFEEGYSTGLFLDQRANRRRLLTGHITSGFELYEPTRPPPQSRPSLLNAFAYTCGFSVAAARGNTRTTSLDLSKKYLEWGKRNFALNQLDPAEHDFIYGDVFDWLRRMAKQGRRFEVILLDPPTFSQSRHSGVFRAEKDYGKLVSAALPLLNPRGVLFASSNAADWAPPNFIAGISAAIHRGGRNILQQHYVPQPPDFPISRAEPAYLKTVWLRVK